MKAKYIDIHAHVNGSEYDADRAEVISRALDNGVFMINVGTDLESSKQVVDLAGKYEEGVYAIIGIHPYESIKIQSASAGSASAGSGLSLDEQIGALEQLIILDQEGANLGGKKKKIVGIGECGLDYFKLEASDNYVDMYDGASVEEIKKAQEILFRKQIDLAIKYDLPLMIHARDSYEKILEILKEYLSMPNVRLRGDVHFFAGTKEQGEAFLGCGFTLSFTGVITFAKQYGELIKALPLESIMSETDCPFVAPIPFRGQRAEPLHVIEVVKKIYELKSQSAGQDLELDFEAVRATLLNNAKGLFCL